MSENKSKKSDELSIEQAIDEINKCVSSLEDLNMPLTEAFASYEKGMKLIKYCKSKIEKMEKDIEIIKNGENEEE